MRNISNIVIGKAIDKSREDKKLRRIVCQNLDADLIKHIQFFQVSNEILYLSVNSSTWSSRLRFFETNIIQILRTANIPITKVKISVTINPTPESTLPTQPINLRTISPDSLCLLDDVVSSMESTSLQSSLKKLISNARKKSKNICSDTKNNPKIS